MSSKLLLFILFVSSCLFLVSECSLKYVVCDDQKSACGDDMQCCKRGSGYRCCPSSLICCQEGSYCCSEQFLNGKRMNSLLPKIFEREEELIQTNDNSNHTTIDNETNAIYGSYLVIDAFLNVTGYYKYSRDAAWCRDDMGKLLIKITEEISVLNNSTLINDKAEFIAKLTSTLSEILFHARDALKNCSKMPAEFKNISQMITKYIFNMKNDYFFKLMINLESNYQEIISLVGSVSKEWTQSEYTECGSSLGNLFNLIFEI